MKPTAEQTMDTIIFRTGKDANYNGRIADIRRFRLNMLGDTYPKKIGFWDKFRAWRLRGAR